MGESSQPDDLAQLRHEFPEWTFGVVWVTANSAPDMRRVWASRGAVFLSAWDAINLAADIRSRFPGDES